METVELKSKSPAPDGQGLSETQCKGNTFSLKSKVLSVLKQEKCTAIMLNRRFGYNDARKTISLLRQDGYKISDYTLNDRRKVYFVHTDGQLSLFNNGLYENN